jgi:uncharacterized protein (TIGR03083 family)
MAASTELDLQAAVITDYMSLADLLDGLPDSGWDTPSLCEGWRVREVVAHLTMPVRYSAEQFQAALRACEGDFTCLSNRVASRDAGLPTTTLVDNARDDMLHRWTPPGGGQMGALTHVVIHGLDITVPLGVPRRSPDETLGAVLEDLTRGGTYGHFGFDLAGLSLRATDFDWSFGTGAPITGAAEDLALLVCGRNLPPGRIERNGPRP